MSQQKAEVQALEHVAGSIIPGTTVRYSHRTRGDVERYRDVPAEISEIAVRGAAEGDHYFAVYDPDRPANPEAKIKVHPDAEEGPRLAIFVRDGVGLEESGVATRAVVEERFTNLSPDFLLQAGGTALEAPEAGSDGPVIAFQPIDPSLIHSN